MRRTVTIEDGLYREIQKLRAKFLEDGLVDDMSFTTAVNLVLYGGLLAVDRFTEDDWAMISAALQALLESLELESFDDRRADIYLDHVKRASRRDQPDERT